MFVKIFEPDYFGEKIRGKYTGHSEQSLRSGSYIDGGVCVVPWDPFFLLGFGTYKRSFTSKIIVTGELA